MPCCHLGVAFGVAQPHARCPQWEPGHRSAPDCGHAPSVGLVLWLSVQAGSPSSWSDVIPSSASLRRQRWLITPYSVHVHRASLEFSGAVQRFCSLAQGWLSSVYLAGLWEGSVTQGRGGGPTTGGLAPLSPPGKPTVPNIVPLTHSLTNTSEQTGFSAPPPPA